MKRFMLVLLAGLFAVACDENVGGDEKLTLSSDYLVQTVWDAVWTSYKNFSDEPTSVTDCLIEFKTENRGVVNIANAEGKLNAEYFSYEVEGSLIVIRESVLAGNFYIVECSESRIILNSYNPKQTLALEREYPQ